MRPATSAHKNRLIDPPSAKGQQISMLTRQHQHSDRVRSKFYACVIRFTPRRHGCGYFRHQPALMQPGLLERVGSCETQCRHAGSNRQSHVECSWKSWRNRCLCRHGAGSRRTPPRLRQPGCSLGSPRDTRWVGRFRGHSFIDPLTGSRLVRRAVSQRLLNRPRTGSDNPVAKRRDRLSPTPERPPDFGRPQELRLWLSRYLAFQLSQPTSHPDRAG